MKKETKSNEYYVVDKDSLIDVQLGNKVWLINNKSKWYIRFWYLISNPFMYIFTGKLRY